MTIEVHQLLIRAEVAPDAPPPRDEPAPPDAQQLEERILAACKAWLRDQLQDLHER